MESISSYTTMPEVKERVYINRRDNIVKDFVREINLLRGSKFKPITSREVAIRLNSNPFFKKSDDECEFELKECLRKGSFSHFFWCCPLKKSSPQ